MRLAAVVLPALLALAGRAAAQPYAVEGDLSETPSAVVDCLVTRDQTTRDCRGGSPAATPALLRQLAAQPRALQGVSSSGRTRVWLLVRSPLAARPAAGARPAAPRSLEAAQFAHYPAQARETGALEFEVAYCRIRSDRFLEDCWVPQDVSGLGYDKATVEMLADVRVTAADAQGWKAFQFLWRPLLKSPPRTILATCDITPEETTANCETSEIPELPGVVDETLAAMRARPLWLPGAPTGRRIEILVLRETLFQDRPGDRGRPAEPLANMALAQRPSPQTVAGYYPLRAQRLGLEGRSAARCKVTDAGELSDCWVVSEAPQGEGFGHALLLALQTTRLTAPPPGAPPYQNRYATIPFHWGLPR